MLTPGGAKMRRRRALWRRRRRRCWWRFRTKVSVHSCCVIIFFCWMCTWWCLCTFIFMFVFVFSFLLTYMIIGRWRWIGVHRVRIIRNYLICPRRWRSSKRSRGRSNAIKYKLFSCRKKTFKILKINFIGDTNQIF